MAQCACSLFTSDFPATSNNLVPPSVLLCTSRSDFFLRLQLVSLFPVLTVLCPVLFAGMPKMLPEGGTAMTSLLTASELKCQGEHVTEVHPQPPLPSEAGVLAFVCSSKAYLSVLPGKI